MKFSGVPWKDKRYLIISEVLSEAGYAPIRADEIKSSGTVVNEVCNHLEHAPLVVIDTTSDSPSVSYEIGFCHGTRRDPSRTILLRQGDGSDIPFNYSHFRHRCYKDLRTLRAVLRDYFDITTPLSNDQCGYAFTFDVGDDATIYGYPVAEAFIAALEKVGFTGRCEYYAVDRFIMGSRLYTVALGLRFPRTKGVPNYDWWIRFRKRVFSLVEGKDCGLSPAENLSELAELRAIRHDLLPRGTAEFKEGKPFLVIDPDGNLSETWFAEAISEILNSSDQNTPTKISE